MTDQTAESTETESTETESTLGVGMRLDDEGRYAILVGVDGHASRRLALDEAATYAHAVINAVARACLDAAIVDQNREIGVPEIATGLMLAAERTQRPPLDDTATAPLSFVPALHNEPVIELSCDGQAVGYGAIAGAWRHATDVLVLAALAPYADAHRQTLLADFGADESQATAVIGVLVQAAVESLR